MLCKSVKRDLKGRLHFLQNPGFVFFVDLHHSSAQELEIILQLPFSAWQSSYSAFLSFPISLPFERMKIVLSD